LDTPGPYLVSAVAAGAASGLARMAITSAVASLRDDAPTLACLTTTSLEFN
jgi:hypothetical protein